MTVLLTYIEGANIVNRFNDFIAVTANKNIIWGLDQRPFTEFTSAYIGYEPFGGNKAGAGNVASAGVLTGEINGQDLYDKVVAATNTYTRIRKLRAKLNVTTSGGSPWNAGTRSAPGGLVYDTTNVANMSTSFVQDVGAVEASGLVSGEVIMKINFEGGNRTVAGDQYSYTGLFVACRDAYNLARDEVTEISITVCHVSCHSNCHTSRWRR